VVEQGVRGVARGPSDVATRGPQEIDQWPRRQPALPETARESPHAPSAPSGFRKGRRNRGFTISKVLRRLWIPLVILVVVASGGFTVARLHGVFGSEKRPSYADTKINDTKPFNPKHLRYEIFGPPGTVATISYFDVNADPQRVVGARLPWSVEFATSEATAMGSIVAQGDSNSIGCRILVDGDVKAERITHEVNAFTFCLLKAA
jgi:hypothetical protein